MNMHSDLVVKVQPAKENFPAVSVVMPFGDKLVSSQVISKRLRDGSLIVKKLLLEKYPADLAAGIMERLQGLYKMIDYNTHSKSVAMYVSPMFEKIIHLNMDLAENICVSDSFNIKDLLRLRQLSGHYNVLVLSNSGSTMLTVDNNIARKVFSSTTTLATNYIDTTSQEPNKDKRLSFLGYTDNVLDNILPAYPYPLFVAGNATVANRFKQNSRHETSVVEYLIGEGMDKYGRKISELLRPLVEDQKMLNQRKILATLRTAERKGKIICGMGDVLRASIARKGSLLVVEENYVWSEGHRSNGVVFMKPGVANPFSYIKDTMGFIIEKVLENGGTIEVVGKNTLQAYHHIALIN